MTAYCDADLLLLPSMYEPGGLVVGEALSRGVCVVVSDEVGSAEPIEGACCRKFPAGNVAEFERQTRALIQDVRNRPDELRADAHAQAVQWFSPGKIADQLFGILAGVPQSEDRYRPSAIQIKAKRENQFADDPSGVAANTSSARFISGRRCRQMKHLMPCLIGLT